MTRMYWPRDSRDHQYNALAFSSDLAVNIDNGTICQTGGYEVYCRCRRRPVDSAVVALHTRVRICVPGRAGRFFQFWEVSSKDCINSCPRW